MEISFICKWWVRYFRVRLRVVYLHTQAHRGFCDLTKGLVIKVGLHNKVLDTGRQCSHSNNTRCCGGVAFCTNGLKGGPGFPPSSQMLLNHIFWGKGEIRVAL